MDQESHQRILAIAWKIDVEKAPDHGRKPQFKELLHAQVQKLVDQDGIADGEYPVTTRVRGKPVTICVRVQSDLFGGTTVNIDATALEDDA